MQHQLQIKRQLVLAQHFKQGQDKFALGGGDEIIGIGHPLGDAFKADEFPQIILLQKQAHLRFTHRGINRHKTQTTKQPKAG